MHTLTHYSAPDDIAQTLTPEQAAQFTADPNAVCERVHRDILPDGSFGAAHTELLAFTLVWSYNGHTRRLRSAATIFQVARVNADGAHITQWVAPTDYTPAQAAVVAPLLIDDMLPVRTGAKEL